MTLKVSKWRRLTRPFGSAYKSLLVSHRTLGLQLRTPNEWRRKSEAPKGRMRSEIQRLLYAASRAAMLFTGATGARFYSSELCLNWYVCEKECLNGQNYLREKYKASEVCRVEPLNEERFKERS